MRIFPIMNRRVKGSWLHKTSVPVVNELAHVSPCVVTVSDITPCFPLHIVHVAARGVGFTMKLKKLLDEKLK